MTWEIQNGPSIGVPKYECDGKPDYFAPIFDYIPKADNAQPSFLSTILEKKPVTSIPTYKLELSQEFKSSFIALAYDLDFVDTGSKLIAINLGSAGKLHTPVKDTDFYLMNWEITKVPIEEAFNNNMPTSSPPKPLPSFAFKDILTFERRIELPAEPGNLQRLSGVATWFWIPPT